MPHKPKESAQPDNDFISRLYEQHKALLFNLAQKYLKNKDDCEDVLQEAVIRLIPHTQTLQGLEPKPLRVYLSLTVRSVALNFNRHQDVVDAHVSDVPLEQVDSFLGAERLGNDLDALILKGEMADKLYQAMGQLPERDQLILMWKYHIGLDNREIGKMLGCQPDSIRMILTRARRTLLEELGKEVAGYGSKARETDGRL